MHTKKFLFFRIVIGIKYTSRKNVDVSVRTLMRKKTAKRVTRRKRGTLSSVSVNVRKLNNVLQTSTSIQTLAGVNESEKRLKPFV